MQQQNALVRRARPVLLAAMLCTLWAPAAGAFAFSVELGGGARVAPDDRGHFSADIAVGMRLPFRYWHAPVFFFPRAGVAFDGPPDTSTRLHVGPGAGIALGTEELTLGIEPAYVTDFRGHGVRATIRLGFGGDIFLVGASYDALFGKNGGTEHSVRGTIGIDFAAMFIGLMRFSHL